MVNLKVSGENVSNYQPVLIDFPRSARDKVQSALQEIRSQFDCANCEAARAMSHISVKETGMEGSKFSVELVSDQYDKGAMTLFCWAHISAMTRNKVKNCDSKSAEVEISL